jgi:hypothetical protein
MKKCICGILMAIMTIACDPICNSGDKEYAIVNNKQKILKITLTYEGNVKEYDYQYYSDGRLKSINQATMSYEYSYDGSGYSINSDNWYEYRFDDIERPSECVIYFIHDLPHKESARYKYTYDGSVLTSLETTDVNCFYKWNDSGDLMEVSSGFDHGGPLMAKYNRYSDVINNFSVPIPGLCLLFPSVMFSDFCYGYIPSKHLPACTYSRNDKGNISKIAFEELGFQIDIEYTK